MEKPKDEGDDADRDDYAQKTRAFPAVADKRIGQPIEVCEIIHVDKPDRRSDRLFRPQNARDRLGEKLQVLREIAVGMALVGHSPKNDC